MAQPSHGEARLPENQWLKIDENGFSYLAVSKNRGTPKWMVYNGKPY